MSAVLSFHFTYLSVSFFLQAQSARLPHFGGVDVHFTGMIDCFSQVVRNKGILSLWNGLTANSIKVEFHSCVIRHSAKRYGLNVCRCLHWKSAAAGNGARALDHD